MNGNQYTQKSQEALQRAQTLAAEYSNQTLEQPHLLAALLEAPDGLIAQLLGKMGKDAKSMHAAAIVQVEKLPRIRGAAQEQGKTYISQEMDKALRESANIAGRMKDEYISVEHLMLALLETGDSAVKGIFQPQCGAPHGLPATTRRIPMTPSASTVVI
jgi:ATP-dependent Clp protease ATP-binding subunit ClpB